MKQYGSICLLLVASIAAIVAEPVYENTFCMQRRCPYDGYFRCKSNARCLHARYRCDGYKNCRDGSDEENCGPAYYGCRGFLCDNRTRCLSHRYVCNGGASCRDRSDEANCLTGRCPFDSDVKCNDTGICYSSNYICNGRFNCRYGNDEENCESRPCPYEDDFRCGDGTCIRSTYVCNRYNNCRDGSDEISCTYRCPYNGDVEYQYDSYYYHSLICYRSYEYCDYWMYRDYYYHFIYYDAPNPNCSTIPCPYEKDYRCPLSGICIRSYEVCDGNYQCIIDHADEMNCTSRNLICPINTWWCGQSYGCYSGSNICYYSRRGNYFCAYNCSASCGNSTQINSNIIICNGIIDCEDGSDESDCYNRTCLADNDFRCESTGACIRQAQVCDGHMHCSDGSDETNCTLRSCSIPGDVKCRDNGTCIRYDRICNGMNDCMDGSDEEDCASKPCPYSDDRRCNTSKACIRADRWCNQQIDCMDGSDEECFDTPCPYAGDFRCAYNGYCVRSTAVCDGYEHCLDGSDEGMNYCPEVFTLGIHWERTLTKTINIHKCSEIYPSSLKLTDVITRECFRNRTWAPVNMSQCVMNSDSPIVMIAVVTLETNSTSLVKSRQDTIIEEIKLTEKPPVHVEIIQSVSSADVSVKITYEFNAFNTTEFIKYINYDMNITTLGNISIASAPNLTIFQSTDVCQCPNSVSSSTVPTGANDTGSIVIVSVCTGKPCQYSNSSFTYQCGALFAGDGRICGKDSDEDGYPDMALKCNDTHCVQDNCPTVHNPGQNSEACNDIQELDDDGLSISTAIGITFVITLIFSILLTLLIVFIVYKMIQSKKSTARNEISATGPIVTDTSLPRDSTIKGTTSGCNDENYEYPEDFNSGKDNVRYQSNPGASLQMNPAYSVEKFDGSNNAPVYENLK